MGAASLVLAIVGCALAAAAIGTAVGLRRGERWPDSKKSRRTWARFVRRASIAMLSTVAVALLWSLGSGSAVLPVLFSVTALNLALGEEYPFSSFPMYANPSAATFFLRFADGSGRTIRLGDRARLCRKIYARERAAIARALGIPTKTLDEASLRNAAQRVFDYLEDRVRTLSEPELPAGIRLYEVELHLTEAGIERRERLVGERGQN